MPIRINLLAEAQAAEELRRRDPVKRVILAGIFLVLLILVYSSSLLAKSMYLKGELNSLESRLNSQTNSYGQVLLNQKTLADDRQKLQALNRLTVNRFLVGTLLNALQSSTLRNVQLVRLKIDQTYIHTEEVKPKPGTSHAIPKPATATEKISLTLNAKDTSPVAGDAVNKFQETLSKNPYFQSALGKVNEFRLTNLGTPQTDPEGRTFVLFTLEARFPEITR
jgi:hypothetical protein